MVRNVLAERFGLKSHREDKELPAYALVVNGRSAKLTRSEGDPNGLPGFNFRTPGVLGARNATMKDFASTLGRMVVNRPVVDKTGLSGRWDFGLEWAPDEVQHGQPSDQISNIRKPDLIIALQEQLGLRLDSTKAKTTTLIIDHVDKPTDN